jgi:hypothetical protein
MNFIKVLIFVQYIMSVSSAILSHMGKQISFPTLVKNAVATGTDSTLISVLLAKGSWVLSVTDVELTATNVAGFDGYNMRFQDINNIIYGLFEWQQEAAQNTADAGVSNFSTYVSDGVNPIRVMCLVNCITALDTYNVSVGTLFATRIA